MIILEQQRGLVYHKGVFKAFLMPGRHFIAPFQSVETYSVDEAFRPRSTPLEILLANEALTEQLEVIEVPDNHIALHRLDGNIVGILGPGKTCFWKGYRTRAFTIIDLDQPETAMGQDRSVLVHPAVREYVLGYSIDPSQQGLLLIDRAFVRILESGTYFFWKGSRSVAVEKIDLRQQQIEITGQDIMSRDKVPLRLNFFCQYRIIDVVKAGLEIKEFEKQFHVVLQLALREYIGSLSLDEILEKKEEIGAYIAAMLKDQAKAFGLELGHSGIKDVILPGEIRDIINQVLIAEKKAQANVIMRREETASTRSLLNTAKLMEENEVLSRLKEFEYIERISEKISQVTLSGGSQILDQLRQLFVPEGGIAKPRSEKP